MRKRKPQPQDYSFALSLAWCEAMRESKGQTVEQAKEAFREHWGRAVAALRTMLKAGDAELTGEMVNSIHILLLSSILPMIRKDTATGQFAFTFAQEFTREVMHLAKDNPPAWLVERAPREFEVPWLMIGRKPAPGFPESVAALGWGRAIVKPGKSQFDKPQTRDVAAALKQLIRMRAYSPSDFAMMWAALNSEQRAKVKRIVALPPLSRKTRAQWWPVVRDSLRDAFIRGHDTLTAKERRSIRAILDYDIESGLRNEYLKRCKIAFNGLCPAE